jgi:RNA polymerase sigma-70 factor (ECF subfamily)
MNVTAQTSPAQSSTTGQSPVPPVMGQRPDRQLTDTTDLLRLARDGDQAAWQRLFEKYRGGLRGAAARKLPREVRRWADADDIVQDVFMSAARLLPNLQFQHAGAFLAYLRRALVNRILDEVRRCVRKPATVSLPLDVASRDHSPLHTAIVRQETARYESALLRLPSRDRAILTLRLQHGLSYQTIALELGMPSPDAVRVASARALRRLIGLIESPQCQS